MNARHFCFIETKNALARSMPIAKPNALKIKIMKLNIPALVCGGIFALSLTVTPSHAAEPTNAPATAPMKNSLAGTQWQLTSPTYAGLTDKPTLKFDDARIGASVGLNQMGGSYQINGQKIKFGALISTKMAGPPALMKAETQYAKDLDGVRTFEISRDGQTLTLRGKKTLTFARVGVVQSSSLANTKWQLAAPVYAGVEQKPTLQFSDKNASASVGLNRINGNYKTAASKIDIEALISTKMAGPSALMQAENNYIAALEGATGYEISPDGQTLTLRGKQTLTFSRLNMQINPLADTNWELANPTYAGLEKKPFLNFTGDSIGASVGLNSMGGGYKIDGAKITFEPLISTMMAGPPALMNAESQYSKALESVRTFEISPDGQTLTLRGAQILPLVNRPGSDDRRLTLIFAATGTVPTGFVATETKIINVAPQLGPEFDGDQTPKYLQLEDLSEGTSWGKFSEAQIIAFDFQPDNRYQLRVQVERDAATGAKQLRLLEVFSQQYVGNAKLNVGDVILEVAPTRVEGMGVTPMQILLVRKVGGQWERFYAPIEGFDFDGSSRYRLQVNVSKIANPPADSSSLRYQLVRVLDKMPVIY